MGSTRHGGDVIHYQDGNNGTDIPLRYTAVVEEPEEEGEHEHHHSHVH